MDKGLRISNFGARRGIYLIWLIFLSAYPSEWGWGYKLTPTPWKGADAWYIGLAGNTGEEDLKGLNGVVGIRKNPVDITLFGFVSSWETKTSRFSATFRYAPTQSTFLQWAAFGRGIFSFDVKTYPGAEGEILDFVEWMAGLILGTKEEGLLRASAVVGYDWKTPDFHTTARPIPDQRIVQTFYGANASFALFRNAEIFAEFSRFSDEEFTFFSAGIVFPFSERNLITLGWEQRDYPGKTRSAAFLQNTLLLP